MVRLPKLWEEVPILIHQYTSGKHIIVVHFHFGPGLEEIAWGGR